MKGCCIVRELSKHVTPIFGGRRILLREFEQSECAVFEVEWSHNSIEPCLHCRLLVLLGNASKPGEEQRLKSKLCEMLEIVEPKEFWT